jgi:hypothetical protein
MNAYSPWRSKQCLLILYPGNRALLKHGHCGASCRLRQYWHQFSQSRGYISMAIDCSAPCFSFVMFHKEKAACTKANA